MPLILLRLGEGRRWDKVCEDLGEGAGDAELIPARPPVEGLRQLRSVIQDPGNCVCVCPDAGISMMKEQRTVVAREDSGKKRRSDYLTFLRGCSILGKSPLQVA